MAKVLNCYREISMFKLQLCYNIHFLTNTLSKSVNPLIPPPHSYELNGIAAVLLLG